MNAFFTFNKINAEEILTILSEGGNVYFYNFQGKRYDVGEKFGFVKTTIELALENEEMKDDLREFLIDLTEAIKVK